MGGAVVGRGAIRRAAIGRALQTRIGGLVVRYGDTLVDTSLKGRLENLRLALSKPTHRTSPSSDTK